MQVKWEILMLTMPSRIRFLAQLASLLKKQLEPYPDVCLTPRNSDGSPLGDQRQKFKEESKGEYISFFDDDDLPAYNYISTIYPLLDNTDVIGFKVQQYDQTGEHIAPCLQTIHSILYNHWQEDETGYYRNFTTCNPMRRELSLAVPIEGANDGEDRRWAERLGATGLVKTEHYIPKVMLHYFNRIVRDDNEDPYAPKRLEMIEAIREGRL
jgi:hypothetical protein